MTPPQKSKIVCECLQVTEAAVVHAIQAREITRLDDIIQFTCAGEGCTACHPLLADYLKRLRAKGAPQRPSPSLDAAACAA
jgi:NAD(P)H-nitrite reductase large subunit